VRDGDPQYHQQPDSGPTHGHGLRNFVCVEPAYPDADPDPDTHGDQWLLDGRL
jgi:hypothetical protein